MNTDSNYQEVFSTPSSAILESNFCNSSIIAMNDNNLSSQIFTNTWDPSLYPTDKFLMPLAPDCYNSNLIGASIPVNAYLPHQNQPVMSFDPLVPIMPPSVSQFSAYNNSVCESIYTSSHLMMQKQNIIGTSPISYFDMYCDVPASPPSSAHYHNNNNAVLSSGSSTLSTPLMAQNDEYDELHLFPTIDYIDRFIAEHEAKLVEPLPEPCSSSSPSLPSLKLEEAVQQQDKPTSSLSEVPHQGTAMVVENCWSYWTFPHGSSSFPESITANTTKPTNDINNTSGLLSSQTIPVAASDKVNIKEPEAKITKRRGRGKGVKNKKKNTIANKNIVAAAAAAAAAHMMSLSSSSSTSSSTSSSIDKEQVSMDTATKALKQKTSATPKMKIRSSSSSSRKPLNGALFVCQHETCGKAFTRPYNLTSHMRTHTTERPYACSNCGRKFARQHDRNRHEKLHWGVRPYACHYCHKTFARMDALNRHLRMEKGCIGTHSD